MNNFRLLKMTEDDNLSQIQFNSSQVNDTDYSFNLTFSFCILTWWRVKLYLTWYKRTVPVRNWVLISSSLSCIVRKVQAFRGAGPKGPKGHFPRFHGVQRLRSRRGLASSRTARRAGSEERRYFNISADSLVAGIRPDSSGPVFDSHIKNGFLTPPRDRKRNVH